jgi:hypothetical protein
MCRKALRLSRGQNLHPARQDIACEAGEQRSGCPGNCTLPSIERSFLRHREAFQGYGTKLTLSTARYQEGPPTQASFGWRRSATIRRTGSDDLLLVLVTGFEVQLCGRILLEYLGRYVECTSTKCSGFLFLDTKGPLSLNSAVWRTRSRHLLLSMRMLGSGRRSPHSLLHWPDAERRIFWFACVPSL